MLSFGQLKNAANWLFSASLGAMCGYLTCKWYELL
jgi:hypothetical protein